jgi:hypothetical protein
MNAKGLYKPCQANNVEPIIGVEQVSKAIPMSTIFDKHTALARRLIPKIEEMGVAADISKLTNFMKHAALDQHVFNRRNLVDFTQRTKECSLPVREGSPISTIARNLNSIFTDYNGFDEISDPLRETYDQLVETTLRSADIGAMLTPEGLAQQVLPALQQFLREHLALALRPTVVRLLAQWLDGRTAKIIEDSFLYLKDNVDYCDYMLTLWDDNYKPDDQRFEMGYITRRAMLYSLPVDQYTKVPLEEVQMRQGCLAILLMFEWDVVAPWKLFREMRDSLDFGKIKAICQETRHKFEIERA